MADQGWRSLSAELVAAVEQVLVRRLVNPAALPVAPIADRAPTVAIDTKYRAHLATLLYRARRNRDAIFGEIGLSFGEPAWDILIDLYRAHHDGSEVSVSSACIASATPPTTGLRHLVALEKRGLINRLYDPFDRRRCFVCLSDTGVAMIDSWVARLPMTIR